MEALNDHAPIHQDVAAVLLRFDPISLESMSDVALLDRVDTKFTFRAVEVPALLASISANYRVLTIGGVSCHRYETVYWDTPDFALYLRHHNGLFPRHKLRFRHYVDSGAVYFEIKAKTNQGRTIKQRVRQTAVASTIGGDARQLVEREIPSLQGSLLPALWVEFKRITLVNKVSPERVTLDLNLTYRTNLSSLELGGLAIAEVKSDRRAGRSPIVEALREQRYSPGSMSKYCFGVATLFPGIRTNLFKENFKRITILAA